MQVLKNQRKKKVFLKFLYNILVVSLDLPLLTPSTTAHSFFAGPDPFGAYLFQFTRALSTLCAYGDVALASHYLYNCPLTQLSFNSYNCPYNLLSHSLF